MSAFGAARYCFQYSSSRGVIFERSIGNGGSQSPTVVLIADAGIVGGEGAIGAGPVHRQHAHQRELGGSCGDTAAVLPGLVFDLHAITDAGAEGVGRPRIQANGIGNRRIAAPVAPLRTRGLLEPRLGPVEIEPRQHSSTEPGDRRFESSGRDTQTPDAPRAAGWSTRPTRAPSPGRSEARCHSRPRARDRAPTDRPSASAIRSLRAVWPKRGCRRATNQRRGRSGGRPRAAR